MPQCLQRCLLILPAVLMVLESGLRAEAGTSDVFVSTPALKEVEIQTKTHQIVQRSDEDSEDEKSLLCPGFESSNANREPSRDILIDFPYENAPIRQIKVVNSTVFSAENIQEAIEENDEINQLIQELQGQPLGWEEALTQISQKVKDAISDLYFKEGYITSQAAQASLDVENGVLEIKVTEGRLSEIQIRGTQQLIPYICNRIRLGASTPLNTAKLEDQLRLLKDDPLIDNIEASLQPTGNSQRSLSILSVFVTLEDPFEGNISFDNYSPPSIGSERLGITLRHRNLTGIGDEVLFSRSLTATGGGETVELAYRLPLNSMNGALQLRVAPNKNKVTQSEFEEFDIRGETELYEITYRQPLVRSIREEFALSVGFTYQDGQTFVFDQLPTPFGIGPDEDGVSRTSVIEFGQEYLRRDPQGAWQLRSQFSLGIGLFNATKNEGSIPDGQFLSWLGQAQRAQRINDDHLLLIQTDIQLTPGSLLPAQQFVIGGGQSVRGYRQNARSGDNGFRFSIEDRIALERDAAGTPTLLLAPFFDMGLVWNNSDNPNSLPSQRFLAGLGMGLILEPESPLSFRFDYGIPLNLLDDRGNNPQDFGLYFSMRYRF